MKHLIFIQSIAFCIIFFSCQNSAITVADANQVVVNAFIKEGDTIKMDITRQFVFNTSDSIFEPISDLSIKIVDGATEVTMISDGKGKYHSSIVAKVGKQYHFSFIYNNKQISSSCTVPSRPNNLTQSAYQLIHNSTDHSLNTSVTLKWDNPDSTYYMVNLYCTESTLTPIYYTTDSRSRSIEPFIADSLVLSDRNFSYYGRHRVVLYHVNREFYELYKRYSSNAEKLTNPPTNITNGLGIFTAYATDTLWVYVRKV